MKKPDYLLFKNLETPMRDGVILRGDLYKPNVDEPLPVVLIRLPYIKENIQFVLPQISVIELVRRGFAVFIQDCRGNGQSGGINTPFKHERDDGYDTVKWVYEQPWCNGRIGMIGQSYFGYTQLAAASLSPPGLVAIAPGEVCSEFLPTAPAGVFGAWTSVRWYCDRVIDCTVRSDLPEDEKKRIVDMYTYWRNNRKEQCWHVPLDEAPFMKVEGLPVKNFYKEWLDNIGNRDYWVGAGEQLGVDKIKVPCHFFTSWFDFMARGTIRNFEKLTHNSKTPENEREHRLVIGPWTHYSFEDHQGDISFGPAADIRVVAESWYNWLENQVKGEKSVSTGAPVKIFVMGENVWRDEQEWPLSRTVYRKLYLDSDGDCRLKNGGGRLRFEEPEGAEFDSYVYDPNNPFDGTGYSAEFGGLRDRTEIEMREDMAVYTTEPFEEDTEVTGDINIKFWLSSSARDTDFMFTLIDVHPNGKAYPLVERMVRARYRNDPYTPEFLEPWEPTEFNVYIGSTAMLFRKGHRIRIEITSSDFPRYNRHLNSDEPIGSARNIQIATQRIYHSKTYPSHIILPVIPR